MVKVVCAHDPIGYPDIPGTAGWTGKVILADDPAAVLWETMGFDTEAEAIAAAKDWIRAVRRGYQRLAKMNGVFHRIDLPWATATGRELRALESMGRAV